MKDYDFKLPQPNIALNLDSLYQSIIPVISAEAAGFYIENCMVCFHSQGHNSGIQMRVLDSDATEKYCEVRWSASITDKLLRSHALRQATDHAACAIALLLIQKLTEFAAIEMAPIGTTVDYYLVPQGREEDDFLIFNGTARLEISGILQESPTNSVESRIKEKLKRLLPDYDDDNHPTYVIVVEFSQPWSKVVVK